MSMGYKTYLDQIESTAIWPPW